MEEPQLSSTDTVGADGVLFGAEVPVPGELIHPLTVCVTVYVAALDTVIDGDVAPVLHNSVPVYPVAVSVEVPQLSTTDTVGTDTFEFAGAATPLPDELVHPFTVCVTV